MRGSAPGRGLDSAPGTLRTARKGVRILAIPSVGRSAGGAEPARVEAEAGPVVEAIGGAQVDR